MVFRRRKFKRKFGRRRRPVRRFRRRRRRPRLAHELKVDDFAGTCIPEALLPCTWRFHDISQGLGATQRVGLRHALVSISLRITVKMNLAEALAQTQIRLAVFLDMQTVSGALPTSAMVYESGLPDDWRNKATSGRFKQLWSTTFFVDKLNKQFVYKRFNRKFFTSLPVRYSDAGSTSITKNIVFCVAQSDGSVGTGPSVFFDMRTRYTDA